MHFHVAGLAAAIALLLSACGRSTVGEACTSNTDCAAGPSTAVCVTEQHALDRGFSAPGGYCTAVDCSLSDHSSCGDGAVCRHLSGTSSSGCYAVCASLYDCRNGYVCANGICSPTSLSPDAGCEGDCFPEDIQAVQATQDVEDTQNVQDVEDTEDVQDIEDTQNTEDTQNFENTQSAEDTQSTEDTESTECYDCLRSKRSKHAVKRRLWWKLWQ